MIVRKSRATLTKDNNASHKIKGIKLTGHIVEEPRLHMVMVWKLLPGAIHL